MLKKIKFLRIWLSKFFFEPASPRPLAAFRIGISLILLWQAYLIHDGFYGLFASTGFVQKEVSYLLNNPSLPRLNWLLEYGLSFGLSENAALMGVGFIYVASLIFLLVGLFTRPAAFVCWFLNWSFLNTGYSGAYGADMYIHIFLFYLIFVPSGGAYSIDCFFKKKSHIPSYQARLGLRVLQLHMCISYLASGIEKASGMQWYNGDVIFIALNTPGYRIMDAHWLAQVPFIPMAAGWAVLVIEIFYCIFIWPKKTRFIWIIATCFLHVGIAIFLRLHVFGLLMCVPTLTLFAFSADSHAEVARRFTVRFFSNLKNAR
jgi:uncharacterized membrane protein YphA (DoxX/SURF4 family)